MKVFLDTSGLLSVFDRSDENHSVCSQFWEKLFRQGGYEPVVSDYVLDELTTRVLNRVSHASALQVLNRLFQLIDRGLISLVWVDKPYFFEARTIFERYHDQEFSFTDCTSFAICRGQSIQDAFALDSDFTIFRLNIFPTQDQG